jgi:hypothetical protein
MARYKDDAKDTLGQLRTEQFFGNGLGTHLRTKHPEVVHLLIGSLWSQGRMVEPSFASFAVNDLAVAVAVILAILSRGV